MQGPPRRLVFGAVAEEYDRFRPTYPERLFDDLVELAGLDGSAPVLEVGTGTGKATVLLAARGIPVLGIEPSVEMAAVARRNASRFGNVEIEIEESDFERWDPRGRRFPLVLSAQAWHWVEPEAGFAKVRDVLLPGGWLAVCWNRFAWEKSELREPLVKAYYSAAPELKEAGSMHPAHDPDAEADWEGDVAGVDGLADGEVRNYEWDRTYTTREYVGLLATASDVRLLEPERRDALCAATREVIDGHGGTVAIRMRTRVCLARRQDPSASTQSHRRPQRLR
jgi:SAM-dependent methyltransferase